MLFSCSCSYKHIFESRKPEKLTHLSSFLLPGKAVFLARDKHHLTDLCHLIRHDTPYLFQEYVKESHGRDVRVVLVGGRVIGSMLRCSTDGRMQSNCSLGRQQQIRDNDDAVNPSTLEQCHPHLQYFMFTSPHLTFTSH